MQTRYWLLLLLLLLPPLGRPGNSAVLAGWLYTSGRVMLWTMGIHIDSAMG
jgi:hypothetical protein